MLFPGALSYGSRAIVARASSPGCEGRPPALEGALNLGRSTLDSMLSDLTAKAEAMARTLSTKPPAEHVSALEALRGQAGVQEATLFTARGRVVVFSSSERAGIMPEPPSPNALRQIRSQQTYSAVESSPERGLQLRAVAPVNALTLTEEPRVLQLVQPVPESSRDAENVRRVTASTRKS